MRHYSCWNLLLTAGFGFNSRLNLVLVFLQVTNVVNWAKTKLYEYGKPDPQEPLLR